MHIMSLWPVRFKSYLKVEMKEGVRGWARMKMAEREGRWAEP